MILIRDFILFFSEDRRAFIFPWQLPDLKEVTVIGFCSFSHSPSHRFPNCYFFYSTRTDKGIEKLWLSMVTYVLCLEGNQAHSFSWILQTHSSLESLMFALQWCPPFPRQDASQKAQAQSGPPRGVLEWPYTAAWKLIIHLHSRLYIQGLQIGSWKLAMVGGFTFRTLRKKVKRNQGLPCPAHQTLPPPPSPRELDLKHQHTAGSM